MKSYLSSKVLAGATLAFAVFGAASAHARSDVYFSIGVQGAPVYVEPAPVYAQPRPVYVEPQPAYGQYRPDEGSRYHDQGWERRGPYGDHDGDGIANIHDPDSPRNQRRFARLYGPYGDLDGDGVMNQDDRDRDGDGVRNRHDRFPDDPFRY